MALSSGFVKPWIGNKWKLNFDSYFAYRREKIFRDICASTNNGAAMSDKMLDKSEEKWLMVVESPAKASTIAKYLGPNFNVVASYGHVRDLPAKQGSVLPEKNFQMKWEIPETSRGRLEAIKNGLKDGRGLLLATDPDREGEAIAWHVVEILRDENCLPLDSKVQRVCFQEITPTAVVNAVKDPRKLSVPLIEAYLARRALDYLLGFKISPILWRKLPGCNSAGRVQSVALRLICERERERERFISEEYWSVFADLAKEKGKEKVTFQLSLFEGAKVSDKVLNCESMATDAVERIKTASLAVDSIKKSTMARSPSPPFTTSTLQQEASSKLGFGAVKTMSIAQRLYEGVPVYGGLITYMRTDSIQISGQAVEGLRKLAAERYGQISIPPRARVYRSKAKNAQEAHEAIRPTNPFQLPESLSSVLDKDEVALYSLIWSRAVASQMENAVYEQVSVGVSSICNSLLLRASASKLTKQGHLIVFQDTVGLSKDVRPNSTDGESEDSSSPFKFEFLSSLEKGEQMRKESTGSKQHFTEPPSRFTEGTMVKCLEELGVGRPSTYASTIKTLQSRSYITVNRRTLIPQMRGRMVVSFLCSFFSLYVDPVFTAQMESDLDAISAGKLSWQGILEGFWGHLKTSVEGAAALDLSQVSDALKSGLATCIELPEVDTCASCGSGSLQLRVTSKGSPGLFLGCSNYPNCSYKMGFGPDGKQQVQMSSPRVLGVDPSSGAEVTLKSGPFGHYLEIVLPGESKPKTRVSVPKSVNLSTLDLPIAWTLLSMEKVLGEHPDGGLVHLKNGRYGWYVSHNEVRAALSKKENYEDITLERSLELLEAKSKRKTKIIEGQKQEVKETSKGRRSESGVKRELKRASPELAKWLGTETTSRSEAVKTMWKLIKDANLQDPNDKRRAILNEPLKELLGVPEVTCLTLSSRVAKHLHPL